jgi:hypothetical protein
LGVNVEVRDEKGRTLATADVDLSHVFWELASKDSCCVRFVDPYGNTVFNQGQIPVLLAELRAIVARAPESEESQLPALIRFIEAKGIEMHVYVTFVGD